jgi:HK97 family phage major capsid protein
MNDTVPTDYAAETKAFGTPQAPASHEEIMRLHEAFRQANDDRLAQLERRMSADVVTREQMDRVERMLGTQQARLDQLMLKEARPALSPACGEALPSEHKQAFEAYVRRGDEAALRGLDSKAMSLGSPQDGGYLVPPETEAAIGKRLSQLSPIRGIAGVRTVSGAVLKKPFALSGPATGWVGETAARPQTASPQLTELQFPTMELYAMPAATASLLEDSAVDLDQCISGEVETAFAEQEAAAFVTGDGVNKPRGFLDYPVVEEGSWAWGSLGAVVTGVAGALPEEHPSDRLIEAIYALKAGYRQNAHWVMNRRTQAMLRKLKDADGNYLWQPPAAVGQKAMLMGFPLVEAEEMPDVAPDAAAIAFGDFQRGYLVVDRRGVHVLRDPYSAKPYVLFYTTKRVGGGVQDFDAIKLIRFGVA